jgi:hypothetical protein
VAKILDAKKLARFLGVRPATVLAWHRRHWIPSLRGGRHPILFDIDEVVGALQQRAAPPGKPNDGGQAK